MFIWTLRLSILSHGYDVQTQTYSQHFKQDNNKLPLDLTLENWNRNRWCWMPVVLYFLNRLWRAPSCRVEIRNRTEVAQWTWCSTRIARAPLSEHGGGAEHTRSSTRSLFEDRPQRQQAEWSADGERHRGISCHHHHRHLHHGRWPTLHSHSSSSPVTRVPQTHAQ